MNDDLAANDPYADRWIILLDDSFSGNVSSFSHDAAEANYRPVGGSYELVSTDSVYSRYITPTDTDDFNLLLQAEVGTVGDDHERLINVDPYEDPCLTNPDMHCTESNETF